MGVRLSLRRLQQNLPRLSRVADYCVPAFLSVYILWGFYLTTLEIGVGWLEQERGRTALIVYLGTVTPLLLSLSYLYYRLLTLPADHSAPPQEPPIVFTRKQIPFETIDERGNLAICHKQGCKGRWKPPRAHHCSTCDVCRVGFDHHCPWIGTCVTTANRPHFTLFLLITFVTLPLALVPVRSILLQHAKNAYEASWNDPWIRANWWDWKGSWIVFGGPGGRYIGAMLLGYGALQRGQPTVPNPGEHNAAVLWDMIRGPSLLVAISTMIAGALSVFCGGLFLINLRNVSRGVTTVDTFTPPTAKHSVASYPIWVPSSSGEQTSEGTSLGKALSRLPEEIPYNLGWRANLSNLVKGLSRRMDGKPYDVPRLNPEMLRRMKEVMAAGEAVALLEGLDGPSE